MSSAPLTDAWSTRDYITQSKAFQDVCDIFCYHYRIIGLGPDTIEKLGLGSHRSLLSFRVEDLMPDENEENSLRKNAQHVYALYMGNADPPLPEINFEILRLIKEDLEKFILSGEWDGENAALINDVLREEMLRPMKSISIALEKESDGRVGSEQDIEYAKSLYGIFRSGEQAIMITDWINASPWKDLFIEELKYRLHMPEPLGIDSLQELTAARS